MKTFVLVHGAFAGAFAWDTVSQLLESAGHKVITFDLPAHGADTSEIHTVSFDSYLSALVKATEVLDRFTLVGHSMAGMIISAAAELFPERLEKLIYVSAYLPQNGQSLQEISSNDSQSLIGRNLQFAPDYSSASLPVEVAVEVFAGDCSDEIKNLVREKSRPEPLAAFQYKIEISPEKFGSVDKYYIETLQDQGVGNLLQKQMVSANGTVKKVFSLNCSHSPYFAKPNELAEILLAV